MSLFPNQTLTPAFLNKAAAVATSISSAPGAKITNAFGAIDFIKFMIKKMQRKKQCVVCGDIGIGKNFGAVTCEPCKVFFRRKILENKKQKCRLDGNCFIGMKTRKRCTSCRMKKCIQMGMKKEFVVNHDRNDSENTDTSDSISDTTSSLCNDTISCLSNDTFDEIISDCDKESNEVAIYTPNNINSRNDSIQKYETNNIDDIPVFSRLDDYKGFTDLETNRLTEVVVSSKLALIKYGCHEILTLRYSILYDINTDYWKWVWKSDTLASIVLFDPNRPNLMHRDVVK
ncbi:unnamed protein product [Medioppia subpectinata]|uniref:Nuclear receptor domain-containing protein n=1 Tax=Medioppia subpectinata TaxID=1979941 RepID=A0A7R9KDB7_9ACAR|nr:unnamed protein product [Medioppia subpectinata]CAG2100010.1 unnamed protein product [Medioppia subpectinata]